MGWVLVFWLVMFVEYRLVFAQPVAAVPVAQLQELIQWELIEPAQIHHHDNAFHSMGLHRHHNWFCNSDTHPLLFSRGALQPVMQQTGITEKIIIIMTSSFNCSNYNR